MPAQDIYAQIGICVFGLTELNWTDYNSWLIFKLQLIIIIMVIIIVIIIVMIIKIIFTE